MKRAPSNSQKDAKTKGGQKWSRIQQSMKAIVLHGIIIIT